MTSISVISKSKVTPNLKQPKNNNFINNVLNIIKQSFYLIVAEALLGVNRIYLLQYNRLVTILSKIYSVIVLCVLVIFNIQNIMKGGAPHKIEMYTLITEYTLFVLIALNSNKNKLKIFFENLSTYDETLNIQDDLAIISSSKRVITWALLGVMCSTFEAFLVSKIYHPKDTFFVIGIFVITTSHDFEQLFYFTFLRGIYMRILILKAHIAKLYDINSKSINKLSEVEKLYEKTQLDVTTLHRAYELLHKCSGQLNCTMNTPILIIFSVSTILTILILKVLVSLVQMENPNKDIHLMTFYIVFRCVKYAILVVFPCYYSSVTAAQTMKIRTVLHDAINTMPMNNIERRKVKTFFQLTRESDFSYAICGVIKLDMSLPLSYMSLCTTYLIIIIQFSKFIE